MRFATFALMLLLAAGCCGPADFSSPPDLSGVAASCPAGAEQSSTAKCDYGVDESCRSPFGYDCHCLCTGYWECDLVHVVCDPADAGTPGD